MAKKAKIIQVPMPAELVESLDELSEKQDVSRSALIREACAKYLTSTEEAEKIRRYIEGYTKYPEEISNEEAEARLRLAAEVWGDEDFSDWEL